MARSQDDKGAILAELFRFPIKRFLRSIRGDRWEGSLREFLAAVAAITTQAHRLPANPTAMLEAAGVWIHELGWYYTVGRTGGTPFVRFVRMRKREVNRRD